jgi:hypothetical protein
MPDVPGIAPAAAANETRRLVRLGHVLGAEGPANLVWESLALSNLAVGFALNRRYGWHAVGALGAVALTAPVRMERMRRALVRLGLGGAEDDRAGTGDETRVWVREVLVPRVAEDAERAPLLAEGALLWLRGAVRCSRRYRGELAVTGPDAGVH